MPTSLPPDYDDNRPTCLDDVCVVAAQSSDEAPELLYQLACRPDCGNRFDAYEMRKNDHVRGVVLECVTCKRRITVFDGARDGYDGVLGNLKFLTDGRQHLVVLHDSTNAPVTNATLRVRFTYNIDAAERGMLASGASSHPKDLFDWFCMDTLRGSEWAQVWKFECA